MCPNSKWSISVSIKELDHDAGHFFLVCQKLSKGGKVNIAQDQPTERPHHKKNLKN